MNSKKFAARKPPAKRANWSSELAYSVPRSQMLDGPLSSIPKPNKTPFSPEGVIHEQ